jgi:alpha-1,2-mannosyltransferase
MSLLGVLSLVWLAAEVKNVTWDRVQLDFSVYLMGAHHLVDGRLYAAHLPNATHLPFTYPPVAALAFAPLTLLSPQSAELVWAAINMASLYAVSVLSLHAVRPDIDRVRLCLWSLVLMGPSFLLDPVRLTFFFGQVNLVLCALILADLTTTVRIGNRTLPRGVLIGVAAAVKLIPLVFVPYLFVTRQVRAAWTALASFAACSLLAAALDPSVSWEYWTKYATNASRVGIPYFYLNQSLQGALDRAVHAVVSPVVVDGLGAVVLVAGIALARWAWRDSSPFLGVLVCAATGMVASPITWQHHLVWAIPVLFWLACAPDRPTGGWVWAAAGAFVLWWAPLERVPTGRGRELHEHGGTVLAASSSFLLLVAFLVGVAVLLAVRRSARDRDRGVSDRPPARASAAGVT